MDNVFLVLLVVIITTALTSGAFILANLRKNGGNKAPLDAIRPIISEMFVEVTQLIHAKSEGYYSIEDYAVRLIKRKIMAANFLTQNEKELFTEDFIRSFIAAPLKDLYHRESLIKLKAKEEGLL